MSNIVSDTTRVCKVCHIEKPIDEFRYGKKRKLERMCKNCRLLYYRERKEKVFGKETAQEKQCLSCGEIKPAKDFSPHSNGKGGLYPTCKQCRRPKNAEYMRIRIRGDPTYKLKSLQRSREYKRANHKKMVDYQRAWLLNHPMYYRWRQRKIYCGDLTKFQWWFLLTYYDHRCAYCGGQGKMQMEHIIPLSRGGVHTASNIVPACQRCNQTKFNRTPEEMGWGFIKPHPFIPQVS